MYCFKIFYEKIKIYVYVNYVLYINFAHFESLLIYFGLFVNAGCFWFVHPDLPTLKSVKIENIEFLFSDFIRAFYLASFAISKPELFDYF